MSRRYVFTLNNFTVQEEAELMALSPNGAFRYFLFGREIGDNGTPHLQGFFILFNPQRLSWCRRNVSARAHFEVARGNTKQCIEYSKKDGDFYEFGSPSGQGERIDVKQFIEWGDAFIERTGRPPSSQEIASEKPIEFLRFPRAVELFTNRAPPPIIRVGQPFVWQRHLEDILSVEADDRVIRFYVDSDGGKGKTWFQQYMLTKYPAKVQVLSIGKRDDLCFAIDNTKSIFLFNIPRDGMQYLQYTVMEQLKDRMVFSCKYHSMTKVFYMNVHVVVFCNEYPDMNKMSPDRYALVTL